MKSLILAPIAFLLLCTAVLAQETVITGGDLLEPWLELLLAFFAVVIPALGAWAAAELRRRTGITVEASHRDALQQALTNGAGLLLNKAHAAADGLKIDTRHPAIREAILYVNDAAPDAIAYFGLTPESLAEKIVAKTGLTPQVTPVVNNTVTRG